MAEAKNCHDPDQWYDIEMKSGNKFQVSENEQWDLDRSPCPSVLREYGVAQLG